MKQVLTLFLICLLVALLWLYWPEADKEKTNNKPSTVSFIEDSLKTQKTELTKTSQSSIDPSDIAEDVFNQNPYLAAMPDEITYMDVYRMKRLYTQCHDVIYNLLTDENFDPIIRFEVNNAHFLKNQPSWPTKVQIEAVEKHAFKCEKLLAQVKSLDLPRVSSDQDITSDYLDLQKQLNTFLTAMKPDSSQAKQVADVLSLITVWNQQFQGVLDLSKGNDIQNAEEIKSIQDQIQQLRNEQNHLSSLLQDDNDPELSKQLRANWQEVRQLERKALELRLINPEARSEAIQQFEVVNSQLFTKLQSHNPDVFFEAQMALELNQYFVDRNFGHMPYKNIGAEQSKMPFIEYVSPGDIIKDMVGIFDNETFGLVIHYATQLYHCELGADCGPGSQWINVYCLTPGFHMDPSSCDLDLATFYQQHLLSFNQWDDVQTVLNTIRGVYVQ